MPEPIVLSDHPLVGHQLASLRDAGTPPHEFRRLVRQLTGLLAYEATRGLATKTRTVQTPVAEAEGRVLADRVGLFPILRAGLGMVDAVLDLVPGAQVWHLGMYRDEETASPVEYYRKLPERPTVEVGLVLDPMLATGGSATLALETLRDWGVPTVKMLSLIASAEGAAAVAGQFPDVQVVAAAVDATLDGRKFIVPGLGDAGDRIFNTSAPDASAADLSTADLSAAGA